MAVGSGTRETTEKHTKRTGILLVSLGAKHARPESIELAVARAEGLCGTLLVCALDTAEIINREVLHDESKESAQRYLDGVVSTLESATKKCSGRIQVKFIRMSEFVSDPSYEKFHLIVSRAYEEDGAFQRHIDNQTFRNLQPVLMRMGIQRRNDPRISALAEYLLFELALILFVSEDGIADIQFGNEPEMGVVDSVFSDKYDAFRLTFRRWQVQIPRNYRVARSGVSGQFGVDDPLGFLLPVE